MPTPLRVAILNDHDLVVEGLRTMLEPFADRLQVVDTSAGTPLDPEPRAPIDIVLYDPFAARTRYRTWRELLGVDWTPRRIALYTWDETPSPEEDPYRMAGGPGVDPDIVVRVSKRLDGEDLVAALEAIDRTGAVHDEDPEGTGAPGPGTLGPAVHDDDASTARQWPGKSEGLSERESEILVLITQGLSNQDLADRLYLSINTVKSYIRTAYRKMNVSTRSHAILWCLGHGFAHHPAESTSQPVRGNGSVEVTSGFVGPGS